MPDKPASEPWHLDLRVPIALILAIIGQTAGAVWWASTISGAVADHARRVALLEAGKVEDARAVQTPGGLQRCGQGLADPLGRRPGGRPLGHGQPPSAPAAGHDPGHRRSLSALAGARIRRGR